VTAAPAGTSPSGAAIPPASEHGPSDSSSPPAIVEACPLCGAPLDPQQDWCLHCGAAARTRLAATPNWRAPIAAIAAVAVLALGVLAAALVKLAGGSEPGPPVTSTVTTASTATTAATPGVPTTIAPGTTATTTPTAGAVTPTAQSPTAGGIASPGTTAPTVTAKKTQTGAGSIPGLSPAERERVEKLIHPGAKKKPSSP
jgi:hypothetical protein